MDQEFKIKIISEADNTGFKSAGEASADLGKDTEKTSDEFKGFHTNARALHSALHLIANESGPAMGAAVSGAAALMTGGLFTAVFAVRELFNWIGALQKKAEDFRERQAAVWLAAETGARNAATAAQEYGDKLDDENEKTEKLKTQFDNQNKLLQTQIEAHKKILEAIEKEQLAAAGGDKAQEAAIKDRFDKLRGTLDLEGERQKIALELKQLGELQIDKTGADLGAKGFEKIKENLVAQASQLKAALDNITKEFGSPEKIKADADSANWMGWGGMAGYEAKKKAWADYQAAADAVATNEAALKATDRALGKAQATGSSDAGQISTLTASVQELTAELKIHTQTVAQERALTLLGEHGGAAALVGGVVANQEILKHGGKLSADQIATNQAFVELMQILGANNNQIIQLVQALVADQKNRDHEIAGLRAQVENARNNQG
jgi:hypothetical protein